MNVRIGLKWASVAVSAVAFVACGGSTEILGGSGQGGGTGLDGSVGGSGGTGGAGLGGGAGAAGMGGGTAGMGGTAGAAGSAPSWSWCQGPGWCEKQYNGCCYPCGEEKIEDFTAVNTDPAQVAAFRAAQCADPAPPCPGCMSKLNPNLAAVCRAQKCGMVDVRTDEMSACTSDADCMLRYSDCCEPCGAGTPDMLIALNAGQLGSYLGQVCGPMDGGCPPCVPSYPPDYVAFCASGHCRVAQVQSGGCPSQPTSGACSQEGLTCTWGDDPRIACRTSATCKGGAWQWYPQPYCAPLPPAGVAGCPKELGVNGLSCQGLEGTICDMSALGPGALCVCDPCVGGGPCTQWGRWWCAPPPAGCPPYAPNENQLCNSPGQSCIYGACGTDVSAGRSCSSQSLWVDVPVACPM